MLTVLDFETSDPLLKKYSSGAVLKFHYPEIFFKILGCGIRNEKNRFYIDFINDKNCISKLNKIMQEATILIMHNSLYDLGCLKFIYKEYTEFEKYLPVIHDTMLMAKLHNQNKTKSYALDSLSKEYNCSTVKQSDILHNYAWDSGLYQEWYSNNRPLLKSGKKPQCHTKPSKNILENFCKTNMELFPLEIISEYCLIDVDSTWELYHKIINLINYYDLTKLSKIIKICLKTKFKGVRFDLIATKKLSKQWKELAKNKKIEILSQFPKQYQNININSGDQIGPALEKLGIEIPKTLLGSYSIKKEWLEEQGHPILKSLHIYRKAIKAEKDFIQKILNYQEIIPEKYKNSTIGYMYPTLKPLGATITGRFSSGGGKGSNELNILAISGRDENFGLPIRELFLPYNDNEKIVCADFSNQEPRLQVHYAKILNCEGAYMVVNKWIEDPKIKYHKIVADDMNIEYSLAKTLVLGLAYTMGKKKVSEKLNISVQEAISIINKYYQLFPFMKQLQKITSDSLSYKKYIKTIGGRKLNIDPPGEYNGRISTKEHKGLSKLIQGSGVDQLWEAMIKIEEEGLNFMLCVHDEIIISSRNPDVDSAKLVSCMENAIRLVVPVIAEVGVGDNWLEAKP